MRELGHGRRLVSAYGPFVGITALGTALGLYRLGSKPLANDEATSFFIARLDWPRFWESVVTSEANGSAFYAVLQPWSDLGTSEFFLRLLPFLFGLAVPLVLYRLASHLFGRTCAIGAAVLLLVNQLFVSNVQNLRSYSLSALLATLATLLFVKLVEDPSWRVGVSYGVIGALSLYGHFFGAWVLLAHVASLIFLGWDRAPWRYLISAYALTAVLAAPLALFVVTQDEGQVDWIAEPSLRQLHGKLEDLTGRGGDLQMALYAAFCAAALVGLFRMRQRPHPAPDSGPATRDTWRWALVVLWLVVPIAGTFAISFVKPLFEARYLLVTLPALAVCVVLGISLVPQRWVAFALWVGLVAFSASQLPDWYGEEEQRVWDERAAAVEEMGRPQDGIIFYAPTVIRPFGYYAGYYVERDTNASPEVIYPGKYWLGFSRTRFRPPLESILTDVGERERVWLISGAARDKTRVIERRTLIDALEQQCTGVGRPLSGVALFTGCSS